MIRRRSVAFAALALACLAAPPVRAEVAVGEPAPAFEGKEFYNSPRVTMADLRGQVLLYEIFRTW
jgi:hypothetical protein